MGIDATLPAPITGVPSMRQYLDDNVGYDENRGEPSQCTRLLPEFSQFFKRPLDWVWDPVSHDFCVSPSPSPSDGADGMQRGRESILCDRNTVLAPAAYTMDVCVRRSWTHVCDVPQPSVLAYSCFEITAKNDTTPWRVDDVIWPIGAAPDLPYRSAYWCIIREEIVACLASLNSRERAPQSVPTPMRTDNDVRRLQTECERALATMDALLADPDAKDGDLRWHHFIGTRGRAHFLDVTRNDRNKVLTVDILFE